MLPRFLSHQAAAATREVDLLDMLSELVDGHADTVELLIGDPPRDVELLAHCEYLRALQRLGHATLAREGDRSLVARFALAAADAGNTSLTRPLDCRARHVACPGSGSSRVVFPGHRSILAVVSIAS
jgi:hypothetical protein